MTFIDDACSTIYILSMPGAVSLFCLLQIYDINKIAELCGMSPGTFVIGAGAGPSHIIGTNSEVSELTKRCNSNVVVDSKNQLTLESDSQNECDVSTSFYLP